MSRILTLDGDKLKWSRPVQDAEWTVMKNGHQRTLCVDTLLSEDQESPHRLYMHLHGHVSARQRDKLMIENTLELRNPNRWKISSRVLNPERVGLTKFVGAPVLPIVKAWRKPFDPQSGEFLFVDTVIGGNIGGNLLRDGYGINKAGIRLNNRPRMEIFIRWPGIFGEFVCQSRGAPKICVREDFINWLRFQTKGNIYPFSDGKSTFESEDDEWTYMTDFHPALDSN